MKPEAFDSSYFHGKNSFGHGISQNMCAYQSKL